MKKENIRDFIQGNYYALKDKLSSDIPSHVKEQAISRALLCPECLFKGRCKICGCSLPNMFFSPNKADPNGRWEKMLEADEWEAKKLELGLDPDYFNTTFKEIRNTMVRKDLKHFKATEFVMGGTQVYDKMDAEFLLKLDTLREVLGEPISLLSSYRSPDYNKKVGGVSKSFHLLGRAVDIKCPTSTYRAKVLQAALALGMTVGVMRTALHIDDRDIKNQKVFHYYPRYGSSEAEKEFNG